MNYQKQYIFDNIMKIDKKLFKINVTKGSGPGGQNKNKVETCVTITHIDSGESETCQKTRSKNKNIEIAYKNLIKKLQQKELIRQHNNKNKKRISSIENSGIIRTYNYAYNEVKDHRTGKKGKLIEILNGNLKLLQ